MKFSGESTMELSREELWKYFVDPDILAECAPGMKEMIVEDQSSVTAVMSVSVGSVSPTFDVEATVTQMDYPASLELTAEGSASRNAFETVASMDLRENDDGTSTAVWEAEANVSGLISSLGQRALGSVTKRLANDFFEDLEEMAADDDIQPNPQLEAAEDVDAMTS